MTSDQMAADQVLSVEVSRGVATLTLDSPANRNALSRAMRAQLRTAVRDALADDAIVTTDSGTITTWAARHIQARRGMKFSCSGNLASMANGLPYAIAAQAAYPDRQVVAFVGDEAVDVPAALQALKEKLPPQAVPRRVALLSSLPLSPNGKFDRLALEAVLEQEG